MIPLYKPYIPELPHLNDVLYSGHIAVGEYTERFECALRGYLGCKNVIATNSFNSAISVAITSFDLKYGDEIIASPMACLASTQPYATAGLKVVWADIDPRTGTLDPDSVRRMISSKTKAIVHNHFCGYPGYIDEINEIGKKNGALVIDDGIECFGTTYKGMKIGDCGTDVTVFSFNPVRVLTTVDGGAVIINDDTVFDRATLVKDCGINRKIFRDELGEISPLCDISVQGYSATLNNINSYIGICQFDELESRIIQQRRNAEKWKSIIHNIGDYETLDTRNGEPNYWVFGILAKNKRDCIQKFRELGFYASGVHINNNIYSVFGKEKTLSGVNEFYNSFVALPSGWWLSECDIDSAFSE